MRYIMLLSMLLIIGFLIYLFANSRFSILSPENPAANIESINKTIDNMRQKTQEYDSSIDILNDQTESLFE